MFDGHTREQTQQSAVGTEETAERTTRENRRQQQQPSKRYHAEIAAHPENADKRVEATDYKPASRNGKQYCKNKIHPGDNTQNG